MTQNLISPTPMISLISCLSAVSIRFTLRDSVYSRQLVGVSGTLTQGSVGMSTISDLFGALTFQSSDNNQLKIGENATMTIQSNRFVNQTINFVVQMIYEQNVTLVPYLAIKMTFQDDTGVKKAADLTVLLLKGNLTVWAGKTHTDGTAYVYLNDTTAKFPLQLTADIADANLKWMKMTQSFDVPDNSKSFEKVFVMTEYLYVAIRVVDKAQNPVLGVAVTIVKNVKTVYANTTNKNGTVLFVPLNNEISGGDTVSIVLNDAQNRIQPKIHRLSIPFKQFVIFEQITVDDKIMVNMYFTNQKTKAVVPGIKVQVLKKGKLWIEQATDSNGTLLIPNLRNQYLEMNDELSIQVTNDSTYMDKFEPMTVKQTVTTMNIELVPQQEIQFSFNFSTGGACVEGNASLFNGHTPLFAKNTVGCKVTFTAKQNEGKLKIGQNYMLLAFVKGFDVYQVDYKLTDIITSYNVTMIPQNGKQIIVNFTITDKIFNAPLKGIQGLLYQSGAAQLKLYSISNTKGVLTFYSNSTIPLSETNAYLQISVDNFKAYNDIVNIKNNTATPISLEPYKGFKFTIKDSQQTPLQGMLVELYQADFKIKTHNSDEQGLALFFAPMNVSTLVSFRLVVSDPSAQYQQIDKNFYATNTQYEEVVILTQQYYIAVTIMEKVTKQTLNDITVECKKGSNVIFTLQTNPVGQAVYNSTDPNLLKAGDTLTFNITDAYVQYAPLVQNFVLDRTLSYFNQTFELSEWFTATMQVNDLVTKKEAPNAEVKFYKDSALVGTGTSDDYGRIIISQAKMGVVLGDTLTAKILDNKLYRDVNKTFTLTSQNQVIVLEVYSYAVVSLKVTVQTGVSCVPASVSISSFGSQIYQNATDNCAVTFVSTEGEGKLKVGSTYQWTATAAGFDSKQGNVTLSSTSSTLSITLDPAGSSTVAFKLTDLKFGASCVAVSGILSAGSNAVQAISDLFGNLIFKLDLNSSIKIGMAANLTITSKRFKDLKKENIILTSSMIDYQLEPHMALKIIYTDKTGKNPAKGLMVAITKSGKWLDEGISNENGISYFFMQNDWVSFGANKYEASCSDLTFKYNPKVTVIEVPAGQTSSITTVELDLAYYIIITLMDAGKPIPNVRVSMRVPSNNNSLICVSESNADGQSMCKTEDEALVKPGDVVLVSTNDEKKRYNPSIQQLTTPLNTRTFNYTLTLKPLFQFTIKVTDATTNKPVPKFHVVLEKNNLKISQPISDENGLIVMFSSESIILSQGDIITIKMDPIQELYFPEKQTFTLNTPQTTYVMNIKPQKQYIIPFFISTGPNCPVQSVITITQAGSSIMSNTTTNCKATFQVGESSTRMRLGQTYQWVANAPGFAQQQGSFILKEVNAEITQAMSTGSGMGTGATVAIIIGCIAIVLVLAVVLYVKLVKPSRMHAVKEADMAVPLLSE